MINNTDCNGKCVHKYKETISTTLSSLFISSALKTLKLTYNRISTPLVFSNLVLDFLSMTKF